MSDNKLIGGSIFSIPPIAKPDMHSMSSRGSFYTLAHSAKNVKTTRGDPGLLECATLSHRFFIYWIATSASPFNSAPWGRGTTEPSWRVVAGVSKNPPLRRRGIIGALSHSL